MGNGTQTWTCARCGKPCERKAVKGQRPKWCSQRCADLGKKGKRRTCEQCGRDYFGLGQRFCSIECTGKSQVRPLPMRACNDCGGIVPAKRKVCNECLQARDPRAPLRKAVEDADWGRVAEELRANCKVVDGCWEWLGQLNKDGYSVMRFGGQRKIGVHRVAASAGAGRWIGDAQHAHHTCANRKCVNPDHVIPSSNIDNVIEMKARNGLLARIAELESALYRVDPTNKALSVLPVLIA